MPQMPGKEYPCLAVLTEYTFDIGNASYARPAFRSVFEVRHQTGDGLRTTQNGWDQALRQFARRSTPFLDLQRINAVCYPDSA